MTRHNMIQVKLSFLFFITAVYLFISGCSSSTEVKKEENKIRYEEKKVVVIKNADEVEREYIKSSNISSIDKLNLVLDSDGKIQSSEKLSTLGYNSQGFLTETIIYDDNGEIKYRFTYDYNNMGQRIKTSRYIDGTLENYYTYEYNEYGNKTKAQRFDTNGVLEEYYIYEYDNEGNLIEEKWFSSTGARVFSIENDYDDGRKSSAATYNENGNLLYEYVLKYDEKGNVVEEIKYDNSGNQVGIIQYVYKYF